MSQLLERLSSLTPEQRTLFESRLKKQGLVAPAEGALQKAAIPRRKNRNYCVLSADQERLWIIDRMEPGNPA
ncbi:MAG TPA: hypothetical protein VI756_21445, partial [Blastocatellia bacterium]